MQDTKHLMIIGAMKAGTTSLFRTLEKHPEICPSVPKEPQFFCEAESEKKLDDYLKLFDFDAETQNYRMDGSTNYAKFPYFKGPPERMAKAGLNPKIIYLVRNPLDRIESHYNYMLRKSQWKNNIDDENLINASNFYLQLQQYRRHFSKEQMLILSFEELKNDNESFMKRVFDFLELKPIKNPTIEQKNKTRYQSKTELFVKDKLGTLLPYIPGKLKKTLKKNVAHKMEGKKQKREKFHQALAPDMIKFQEEYGFDVSKWGFR